MSVFISIKDSVINFLLNIDSFFIMYKILIGKLFLIALSAYIIGSIPTGYLIVKSLKKIDIRKVGSGSTGATNVKRIMGAKWFFIVMLLDALKGAIPVLITIKYFNFFSCYGLSPVIAATMVIIGHSKSIFLNFTGGKSVATSVGTLLALSWPVGTITAIIWGILTYFTKYVSLGSIVAMALAPILMNAFNSNIYYIWYASISAILVILRHKDNIKRLTEGKENKVRK